MREWLKRLPWKGSGVVRLPRVRIPPLPPMVKTSIWSIPFCDGCGELLHKCYCAEDCPTCKKKLKDCIADSDTGYCPNKVDEKK